MTNNAQLLQQQQQFGSSQSLQPKKSKLDATLPSNGRGSFGSYTDNPGEAQPSSVPGTGYGSRNMYQNDDDEFAMAKKSKAPTQQQQIHQAQAQALSVALTQAQQQQQQQQHMYSHTSQPLPAQSLGSSSGMSRQQRDRERAEQAAQQQMQQQQQQQQQYQQYQQQQQQQQYHQQQRGNVSLSGRYSPDQLNSTNPGSMHAPPKSYNEFGTSRFQLPPEPAASVADAHAANRSTTPSQQNNNLGPPRRLRLPNQGGAPMPTASHGAQSLSGVSITGTGVGGRGSLNSSVNLSVPAPNAAVAAARGAVEMMDAISTMVISSNAANNTRRSQSSMDKQRPPVVFGGGAGGQAFKGPQVTKMGSHGYLNQQMPPSRGGDNLPHLGSILSDIGMSFFFQYCLYRLCSQSASFLRRT
jgi:hypothetical protein